MNKWKHQNSLNSNEAPRKSNQKFPKSFKQLSEALESCQISKIDDFKSRLD